MNMNTHEILLSMMIIILCSAPIATLAKLANGEKIFGRELNQIKCVNGIYHPLSCNESKIIRDNAEETGKLSLMYIVDNTNEYDRMFETFAQNYQSTMIVKIDKTKYTTDNDLFKTGSLPKMVFFKFGNIKEELSSFTENDIKEKIDIYEKLTAKYEDGIYVPQNDGEAKKIKYEAEETGKLSLMYIVENTNEYDDMFRNFAKSYQSTTIMKIDKTQYVSKNRELLDAMSLPKIVLYKFGKIRDTFYSTQENEIEEKIQTFEKLQVKCENGIYVPRDTGETKKIIKDAEKTGKLSLVYIVENTDEYDETFKNLADRHQSTVFIKINKTKYTPENNGLFNEYSQSQIVLIKSEEIKETFSSTVESEIENKIKIFE